MEPLYDRGDTDVGDYVGVLRRRWKWLVAGVALAVGASLALSFSEIPTYQATSQLLLQPKQSESVFGDSTGATNPERALQNELKVIQSKQIQDAVAEVYGSPISVGAVSGGDDDIIILSAKDESAREAARKVNVYASTYQTARLESTVGDLARARVVIQDQIDQFQESINDLDEPVFALDRTLGDLPTDDPKYAEIFDQRQQLRAEQAGQREDLQSQLNEYQQRLQVLQVSERLTVTGGVQILNPAAIPSSPISPNPVRDAIQAAFIGLFLGMGLGFLAEQVDDRIRSVADLERVSPGVPVMGLIPHDESWKDRTDTWLSTQETPLGATAEAFRGLRTSLQYSALEKPLGIIQVTSATADEGKTSTLANLALAFAEAGAKVAVVGCDLRKPRIHRFLGVDGSIGLTSMLLRTHTLDQCLQQSPLHENVVVLPSGPRPPNPSELLSLDRTGDAIRSLLDENTVVLVDSPPVLPVTDALVLARCVDATLFLALSGHTSRGQVKLSFERFRQIHAPVVGTVLNGVSAEETYSSLYEYYAQPDVDGAKPSSRWRPFRRRPMSDVPLLVGSSTPHPDLEGPNGPSAPTVHDTEVSTTNRSG